MAKKSKTVPKAQREIYEKITALTDPFCLEHLNEGYRDQDKLAEFAFKEFYRIQKSS